jgi:hypothetical protein
MSKIEVDTVEPQSGTSLTLGASGDTITIPAGATFDSSAATTTYCTASLEVTVNNSTYVPAAYADTQFYGGTSYNTTMLQYFVNVTDVSTHKVRFVIDAVSASTTTIGSSTNTGTGATFIRLGAT